MSDPRVKYEVRDGVAYVTIDRPEAKNALTQSMYLAIKEGCEQAEADDSVQVVVVTGSNGVFVTGGDLKEILEFLESDRPTDICDYERFLPFETVRSLKKPSIAMIDGLCLGGGLTLALMCDILVCSDRSRFAIPENKVGLVDGHLPRLLRQAVPPAKLRYWMYTGVMVPAQEAYEVGLVTKVVPQADLGAAVAKVVSELKASSLPAIAATKKILNETRPLSPMTDAYIALLQPEALKHLQSFAKR